MSTTSESSDLQEWIEELHREAEWKDGEPRATITEAKQAPREVSPNDDIDLNDLWRYKCPYEDCGSHAIRRRLLTQQSVQQLSEDARAIKQHRYFGDEIDDVSIDEFRCKNCKRTFDEPIDKHEENDSGFYYENEWF